MKNRNAWVTLVAMALGLTGGLALGAVGGGGNDQADPTCVGQCRRNCAAQFDRGTPEYQECTAICVELCQ